MAASTHPGLAVEPLTPIELRYRVNRRQLTMLLAAILIPMLWFLIADFSEFAGEAPRLGGRLATRVAGLLIIFGALVAVRRSRSERSLSNVGVVVAVWLAAVLLALNAMRPAGDVMLLRTPLMALIVFYGAMPNSKLRQLAPPLVYSAGIAYQRYVWLTGSGRDVLAADLVILIFVNLVGILMVTRRLALERELDRAWDAEHAARELAEANQRELRTLRGIIQVCAYCRKVHNEDGAWQQIEAYVRAHSYADFSHGICPSCVREHYPQFQDILPDDQGT